MLIDWPTVAAQIINFLILLALLKWLLFDRIVRAMDERESKIAARLQEAAEKQDEARRRSEDLAEERRRLDGRRDEMLDKARQEADQRRRELVQEAREEVDRQRQQWQRGLKQQQEQFIGELGERAGEALQQALRQALRDLADDDLQQGTVRVFLNRLEEMDGQKRETFGKAVDEADGRVVVASARELPDGPRRKIADALKRRFRDDLEVAFETSLELLSGLEIRSHGQALGWSLRRYVDEFEETLGTALHERIETAESTPE